MDSATLAGQITNYDKNKVDSSTALNDALKQYGVPEIRGTVAGLRTTLANTTNSLNAVDPSVTGRTQGSLVTEAQRQKQVANERAPIAEQLGTQSRALDDNQKTLQDALSQANQQATNKVNDYQSGRNALTSQYDMTYTREQNTAKQQQQAAAEARQRELDDRTFAQTKLNSDRTYALNVQQANDSRANSSRATASESKQANGAAISQSISSMAGKDGYVSRATFANALSDFQVAGLGDIRKFWQIYGHYANPKTISQYANYKQR